MKNAIAFSVGAAILLAGCTEQAADDSATAEATAADTQSIASADTSGEDSIPCPIAASKDWAGWLDTMPGPDGPKLIVTGRTEIGSAGYGPVLTFAGLEEKMVPNVLIELTLAEKADGQAGWQEARFEMEAGEPEYDLLKISCHGEPVYEGKIETVS